MASEFPRHLLELESLTRGQIETLLDLAARFKHERAKARAGEPQPDRRGLLTGRTVITLFFEHSTRTRSPNSGSDTSCVTRARDCTKASILRRASPPVTGATSTPSATPAPNTAMRL